MPPPLVIQSDTSSAGALSPGSRASCAANCPHVLGEVTKAVEKSVATARRGRSTNLYVFFVSITFKPNFKPALQIKRPHSTREAPSVWLRAPRFRPTSPIWGKNITLQVRNRVISRYECKNPTHWKTSILCPTNARI